MSEKQTDIPSMPKIKRPTRGDKNAQRLAEQAQSYYRPSPPGTSSLKAVDFADPFFNPWPS